MQEMWVQSLGWEDPLEEEMAAHSNVLPWEIPWTEEPGGLQSRGSQESDTTERLHHQGNKQIGYFCRFHISEFTSLLKFICNFIST